MRKRHGRLGFFLALFSLSGCAAAPSTAPETVLAARGDDPGDGPRIDPDDRRWRRQPLKVPPLYLDAVTGSGRRLTMVTPLYWDISGLGQRERYFIPAFHHASHEAAGVSSGHVLNYFWASEPGRRWKAVFPIYYGSETPAASTALYGPLYVSRELGGSHRRRTVLPFVFSREADDTGYDYWSVGARLFGVEKQFFDGEERKRLWLLFFVRIPV